MDTSRVLFAEDLETKTEQLKNMITSLQGVDPSMIEGVVVGVLTRTKSENRVEGDDEEGMPVDFMAFLMGCPAGIKFTFTKVMECMIGAIKEANQAQEEKDQQAHLN